ncbi:MAG TPA: hypothetical protein VJ836_07095 [Candidatus Saccharimonadales bacterium]|nr:hypothetical protein [Candidatus Saccharimonadales bacterium]
MNYLREERRFVVIAEPPVSIRNGELTSAFEVRPIEAPDLGDPYVSVTAQEAGDTTDLKAFGPVQYPTLSDGQVSTEGFRALGSLTSLETTVARDRFSNPEHREVVLRTIADTIFKLHALNDE